MTTPVDTDTSTGGILGQLGVGSSSFNVMLLLATVLSTFSSSQLQTAAVQAQTTELDSELAVDVSNKGMAELEQTSADIQTATNKYNSDLENKKNNNTLTEDQNNISEQNTEFSLELQMMNTNVQTAQGLSQGAETAAQMTTTAIQSLASMFSVIAQFMGYISNLIQK